MDSYRPRQAKFIKVHQAHNWRVKLYTLTLNEQFLSHDILDRALDKVPLWIENKLSSKLSNYNIACLIVHEGREGVFSILNWWVDENMLKNQVFITTPDKPTEFKLISDSGIAFCVWELGIIWHERNAWIKHVLENPEAPEFSEYLNDTYSGPI